jgi:3-deoxy-D-manno-octulosonate 8-phosphate phosphatase KdsC-like HAD superfamily phosphatase
MKIYDTKDMWVLNHLQKFCKVVAVTYEAKPIGKHSVTSRIMRDCGIDCIHTTDKALDLDVYRKSLFYSWKNVSYIGDDIADYLVLRKVILNDGMAFCPEDAASHVREIGGINIIQRKGGCGAIREVIDYLNRSGRFGSDIYDDFLQ